MANLWQTMMFGGTMMLFGDIVAQKVRINFFTPRRLRRRHKNKSALGPTDTPWDLDSATDPYRLQCGLDAFQSIRMALINGMWAAPNQYGWYHLMKTLISGQTLPYVLLKVVLTQAIFSPWINGSMLALEAVTRTGSVTRAVKRVHHELFGLLLVSWSIWPVESLISFTLVHVDYQAIIDQIVGVFWLIYCAWVYGRRLQIAGHPSTGQKSAEPLATGENSVGNLDDSAIAVQPDSSALQ